MAKEIFPKSVFENQTNGTVFYREGKLNDPMMPNTPNMAGIFESWRYSFDSGKQIFRAEAESPDKHGKVMERRLIKDKFGNPHWSDWVEISNGEAHGIQAIAINDRPLLLPNADGAIKLMITPQMIGTLTANEILSLVRDTVADNYSENYIYVKWDNSCETPYEVINKAFPNGGTEGKYYLVEAKPEEGVVHNSTYFVYEQTGATTNHGGYDFIKVEAPADLGAFVSYSVFNEHTNDSIIHVTQEEKDKWNSSSNISDGIEVKLDEIRSTIETNKTAIENSISSVKRDLEGKITAVKNELTERMENGFASAASEIERLVNETRDSIEAHVSDDDKHITAEERSRIASMYATVGNIPTGEDRYILENGRFVHSFEQIAKENSTVKTEEFTINENFHRFKYWTNKEYIITKDKKFVEYIENIIAKNNFINECFIEMAGLKVRNGKFKIVANTGFSTDWYDDGATGITRIKIPLTHTADSAIADATPDSIFFVLDNDEAVVETNGVRVYVRYSKKSAVQIGDPAKALPLNMVGPENTVPTYNGKPLNELYGGAQWKDIVGDINLNEALDKKLADALNKAVKVANENDQLRYDVFRDGLIRSICQQTGDLEEKTFEMKAPSGKYLEGQALFEGIRDKFAEIEAQGYVIQSCKLDIEHASTYQNEKGEEIPLYFKTDNGAIDQSVSFSGTFNWNWPGKTFEPFDKIILGNGSEYITNPKFIIKTVKFGDVEIGLLNELTKKYYNATLKAEKFAVEADEIELGSDDTPVKVHGQEADERYASRELFEKECEARAEADLKNAEIAAQATTALKGEFESKVAEISDKVDEFIGNAEDYKAEVAEETEERKRADEALAAVIDTAKAEIDELKKTTAKKEDLKKYEKTFNVENFDLIIDSNEKLLETLKDGTFEDSKTILFKAGYYSLPGDEIADVRIDFSKIVYIKGERLTGVDLSAGNPPVENTFDATEFEGINFEVGSGVNALVISDGEERTKKLTVSGKTTVLLLPQYSRYELNIEDDAEITFSNVQDKEYTIFIDQNEEAKNVKIANASANNSVEFTTGLENQKPMMRTILKIRGNDDFTEDAIIVEEVIYGVSNGTLIGSTIPVRMYDTLKECYGVDMSAICVNANDTSAVVGGNLVLNPTILTGWAHNDKGADYEVIASDGTVIGEGNCDEETIFKVPETLRADYIGVYFKVKPQIATIMIDDMYAPYVVESSKSGFVKVQAYYGTADISFDMEEGYSLYGLKNPQRSEVYQGTLPYTFQVAADASRKDFDLKIEPRFYRDFSDFALKVVSDGDFNKEKSAFVGNNKFKIEPAYTKDADANFGVLYTAAPITFIGPEGVTGSVDFVDAGKTQEATLNIPSEFANKYVNLEFAIAGDHENVTKKLFITTDGASGEIVGSNVLDKLAGETKTFEFEYSTFNAEDIEGEWSVSDSSIISIVEQSLDGDTPKVKVQIKKNGIASLIFKTNNFGCVTKLLVESRVHAASIKCDNISVTLDSTRIMPPVRFYDIDGNEIGAADVYDSTGVYKVVEEKGETYLNDEYGDYLNVRRGPFPSGVTSKTEQFKYISNDAFVEESIPGTATITGKKYRVSIDWSAKDTKIDSLTLYTADGVSKNGNAFVVGGTTVSIIIKLVDGSTFTNTAPLTAAFEEFEVTDSRNGYFSARAVMPTNAVNVSL